MRKGTEIIAGVSELPRFKIDDTLRGVVPEALGRQLEIYSEFLDVEHFSDAIYAEISADFLGHKYSRSNVGVIVTIGAEALQFLLRYRGRVVPNAPVVHINMTQEQLREMQVPPDVVGWTVDLDPAATLATSRTAASLPMISSPG